MTKYEYTRERFLTWSWVGSNLKVNIDDTDMIEWREDIDRDFKSYY